MALVYKKTDYVGPSNKKGIKFGSVTIDPHGNYWKLQGKVSNPEWTQITGDGGILKNGDKDRWIQVNKNDIVSWSITNADAIDKSGRSTIKIGPLGKELPTTNKTKRWPIDAIGTDTDYVFFQFGRYIPPFSQEAIGSLDAKNYEGLKDKDKKLNLKTKGWKKFSTYEKYNASANALDVAASSNNVMLPIPQDLSNEIQQQWQGKQFTSVGRAATAALAAGNLSYANDIVNDIASSAKALQIALTTTVLNSIPGVGGNISFNDVSGSSRGIVINPNAELLYDAPDMREVGMIFRMVPKNQEESEQIQDIVKVFRKSSMPSWGAAGSEVMAGDASENRDYTNDIINYGGGGDNFIRVPHLCKFTFMKGDKPHPYLIQFKPCAISKVEVNYTPDGTFATYSDGAPVAVELSLSFMETKLVFADEVEMGY